MTEFFHSGGAYYIVSMACIFMGIKGLLYLRAMALLQAEIYNQNNRIIEVLESIDYEVTEER